MTATLTRDEILALPAGEATDALIAERVMGWRKVPGFHEWYQPGDRVPSTTTDGIPHWSTDIAAAWAVVEHLKADAWEPMVIAGETYDEWSVQIATGNPINAPTAPLAICRAALIAAIES